MKFNSIFRGIKDMTEIKKFMFITLSIVMMFILQFEVSADEDTEYIVKFKSTALFSEKQEQLDFEPLIPDMGLYTTKDITGLNPDLFEFIEEDAEVELFDTYDYSSVMTQQEYVVTGIKSMWDIGVYGKGIRIGVIDSGCSPHTALQGNLCEGASFVDGVDDTNDSIGHGTAVCGVIAGRYGSDKVIGTAHKSNIIPLKFIDRDSDGRVIGGTTKRLANAVISAVDDFHCDIINISSGSIDSHTLKLAVDYAVSNGVIVVAAVGNSGSEAYNYPAAYDNVIGVGSVDNSKEHSHFSNTNSSVFVAAPGENINTISGDDTEKLSSGTSFSAPCVSGIIADMLEIKSELTLNNIMDIISETAEDLGSEGYDELFGYGLIRADSIINYMLNKCECFVSAVDLCPTDNFNEVRFRMNSADKYPQCIFAEYTEGALNQINLEMHTICDNVFILRLEKTDDGLLKYFVWDSINSMVPIQINEGIK